MYGSEELQQNVCSQKSCVWDAVAAHISSVRSYPEFEINIFPKKFVRNENSIVFDVSTRREISKLIDMCCEMPVENVMMRSLTDEGYEFGVGTMLLVQRCSIGEMFCTIRSKGNNSVSWERYKRRVYMKTSGEGQCQLD